MTRPARAVGDSQLAEDFGLRVQTATLACNYFDRYMNSPSVAGTADKRLIQMIASTCLLIAAKFADRKLPPLSELQRVHHSRASADEFATLELRILKALQWKLHVPLPHAFVDSLRSLCDGAPVDEPIEDRTNFFIDLSVYGEDARRPFFGALRRLRAPQATPATPGTQEPTGMGGVPH